MNEEKKIHILKMEDVLPNRFQPRIKFDDTAIHELAQSIKEHGVIQPIVVRPLKDKYEIIAGERRYKASMMVGKQTIPAIITDLNDKESAEVALIENVQRQNLTPIEEAISYRKILDMGYLTQEQLAEKLGKSQSSIANKLRLLNLHEEVQEALLEGSISERHARSLLKLDSMEDQKNMLGKIIKERLTVRKADEEIDKLRNMSNEEKENMFQQSSSEDIEIFNLEEQNQEKPNFMDNSSGEISIPEIKSSIEDENGKEFVSTWNPVNTEMQESLENKIIQDPIETTTNPGFMDIDHIEEVAKDIPIFAPINEEKENIHNNVSFEPNIEISNDKEESDLSKNHPEEISPIFEQPLESKFFNFGISQNPVIPEEPIEKVGNNEFNFDFDSFFNQNNALDKVENEKDETANLTEENNISPFNSWISTPNNLDISENKDPLSASTLSYDPISISEKKDIQEEPIMEIPIEENEKISNSSSYTVPEFIEKIETPEMELNNHIIEKDNMPLESEEYDIRVVNQFDIKRVTSKLREFTRELENMGYKVDTDEIDFENFYQINIKIDK